uniref:Uncharacterized protein n=1 Tax=Oryza punctata TaxID=4537 RepID=A0A0E0KLS1_ORYPU
MCIVVTKSPPEIVRPSEPVTTAAATGKIIFSPLDRPLAIVPVVVLQVFEHPIHEPVETIRRGLSQALIHYYPLAGRLAGRLAGEDYDEVHIDCTGEGVTFVSASANCTVKQLMRDIDGRSPDAATAVQRELIADYPANGFGRADSLILMQITTFTCGGFVVGVTWNHGAADGFGIAQFLQAVGELARGLPSTSVIPVRCDESIQAMSPSFVMAAKQFMFGVKPAKLALHSITIPSRMINSIRGPSCTVFEAVAAALWRSRTRVVMSDPDAPTVLAITVNSRKYMGFLQAVGELARGLPSTSVIPVRCDESIQAMSPSFVMAAKQFMFGVKPAKLALHSITIPSRMINSIRGPSCTVFEAVAAALWRSRTRVVMSDPDAPTVLAITVNSRKYMGVKDGYYGNCATVHMAVARSGEVADGDILDVVRTIRRAKEEIPERLKKGDVIGELSKEQLAGYESVLLVTCWRNIGFEAVDFGGGKTARVMTTYEQSLVRPMCVVCLPCQGEEEEGGRVLSSCVTAHHADAFLREIATL